MTFILAPACQMHYRNFVYYHKHRIRLFTRQTGEVSKAQYEYSKAVLKETKEQNVSHLPEFI